ncbi:hypothetical protein KIKIMORA_02610 [Brevundimonas phage vB_BpoS-Kikimora]|uniref:Uncharacterized protein n=1 Tax=Brevundimonas phage vB_BpoS-Kikimora TaxID=2948601 RepID=A0A9E7MST1_9CAUD|nr:hypothetical protein KIKIMORA_02610 [Brevundimonas phage vB_BpoS-Kikimora]
MNGESLVGRLMTHRFRNQKDIVPCARWLAARGVTVEEYRARRKAALERFEKRHPEVVTAVDAILHGNR